MPTNAMGCCDVPPHAAETARAVFDSHDPHIAVADVVFDSMVDGNGDLQSRRLLFSSVRGTVVAAIFSNAVSGHVTVELYVTPVARHVVGLQWYDGNRMAVTADETGHIVASLPPSGLVSFLLSPLAGTSPDSEAIDERTAWIRV